MKIRLLSIIISLLFLTLYIPSQAKTAEGTSSSSRDPASSNYKVSTQKGEITSKANVISDILYKKINSIELKLDLYLPKGVKNAPLIVWTHGGAWMRGDKIAFTYHSKNINLLNALLEQGYAVASVNYRLSQMKRFPAQIQDLNDAIEFLWQKSDVYGLNKNRIAVMGRSAGAHLAALAATSYSHKVKLFNETGNKYHFDIDALVAFFAPSDLLALKDNKDLQRSTKLLSAEGRLLGYEPENVPEIAKLASPITYVDENTPPTILLHGEKDTVVPAVQSANFKVKLNNAGVPNEFYILKEGSHGDPEFDNSENVARVLAFLDKYFPAKKVTKQSKKKVKTQNITQKVEQSTK